MSNYVLKYEYEIPEMKRTALEKVSDRISDSIMAVRRAIASK